MPITSSAKKALKVSKRRQAENLLMKQEIKNKVKGLKLAVAAKAKDVTSELSEAYSALDKAAKKHLIHKNKASRLKSRLTKAARKAELKIDSKIKEKAAIKPVTKTAKPVTKAKPKANK